MLEHHTTMTHIRNSRKHPLIHYRSLNPYNHCNERSVQYKEVVITRRRSVIEPATSHFPQIPQIILKNNKNSDKDCRMPNTVSSHDAAYKTTCASGEVEVTSFNHSLIFLTSTAQHLSFQHGWRRVLWVFVTRGESVMPQIGTRYLPASTFPIQSLLSSH